MPPVTFEVVAPDGRRARVTGPDGATQDQLLEKARAVKAQMAATTAQPPAAAPLVPTTTSTTSTTTSDTPVPQPEGGGSGGGLGLGTPEDPGLVGTALYRGLFRPAQYLASALPGATMESLEKRRNEKVDAGVPGAAYLPIAPAEGFLGTAGALLAPLEATAPVLWGLGTVTQMASDQHVADIVEGALGLRALVKVGVRGGRALIRAVTGEPVAGGLRVPEVDGVPRPDRAGRTSAEAQYLDQRDVAVPAAERTADAGFRSQAAAESDVQAAQEALRIETDLAAKAIATANRQRDAAKIAADGQAAHYAAARNRVDAMRQELQAAKAKDAAQPANVVRSMLGIPERAPNARTAGEILTAAGEERTALVPGAEPVGVASARYTATQRTREAYAAANEVATQQGVTLPLDSSTATEMLDAARQWAERVGKYATPLEKDTVGEILTGISSGDLPYAALNDLHAQLSTISLNPRDYAATAGIAKKELTRFKFAVQTALRTLEVATPELADAAHAARAAAREGEKVRATARALIGQTPETAFTTMTANPTHLRRVFQYAGPAEQDTYRMAFWHDAVERATDAQGSTDIGKLLTTYDNLPAESRTILASGATAEARAAMTELAAGGPRTAQIARDLDAAKSITRQSLESMRDLQRQWTKAAKRAGVPVEKYADVVQARKTFVAAEKEAAARAGDAKRYRDALAVERKTLAELGGRMPSGNHPPEHARSLLLYHGFQALRGLFGGGMGIGFGSLTHGGLAFALSRNPRLIRDTATLPVASPQFGLAMHGLGASLRGWRGFVEEPQEQQQEPLP